MEKLSNRVEDNRSAFRPFSGRLSNSHSKIVPPSRFVATRLVCGLKEYAELHNANPSLDKEPQKYGLASHSTPATKLAGRYKVVQLIGQGQSSIIVAAEDLYHPSKKVVAVKIMNLDYSVLGSQEADCIYQLNRADPFNVSKIVRLLNKFIFQDHFCMVFELLRPRPLHMYFQESYFNSEVEKLEKIREVAVQVLGVLGFLRRENVIHADLKPENILLDSGRCIKVKVVDFGNAIRWIHREMSLYYDNFELQTLLYRAPEVIFGVPFGPEVDVWSLGCILAELYLGKPLFVGKNKSEVLQEIVSTLGPLPRIPFQSGKFYSDFAGFLNSKTGSDAASTETRLMRRLNNMKNFTFANFLSGLLQYNPNKRFTPVQAISHPFLAAHVPFGEFLSNSITEPQGCHGPSRSGVLLNSTDYQYRPHIDDDIRRQHLSAIDLLYVGTRGKTSLPQRSSTPPVGRVVPLVVCGKTTETKIEGASSLPSSSATSLVEHSFGASIREQQTHAQSFVATKPEAGKERTNNETRNYKRIKPLGEEVQDSVSIHGNYVILPTSRVQLAAESAVVQCHKTNRSVHFDTSPVNKSLITKDSKTCELLNLKKPFVTPSELEHKTSTITAKRKHAITEAVEYSGTRHKLDDGIALDLLCTTARTRGHFHTKKMKHDQNEIDSCSISMLGNTALTDYKPSTPSVKKSQLMNRGDSGGSVTLIPGISQSNEKRTVSLRQDSSIKKKTKLSLLSKEAGNPMKELMKSEENTDIYTEVKNNPPRKARRSLKLLEEVDCDVLLL